ncbi:MAG: hypothetical protein Q7R65_04890 [bacterium]|nr:hypothetical protein [bacterium]
MKTFDAKSILVKKSKIDETLAVPGLPGKNLLEPFRSFALENKLPFSILEDTAVSNDAEVHMREGDLWFCLRGRARFLCGGKLVEPQYRLNADGSINKNELYASRIIGGTEFSLKAGGWLWIPAGEPHQHGAKATARLMIIKIPLSV